MVNADRGVPPGVSALGVSRKDIVELWRKVRGKLSKIVDQLAVGRHFVRRLFRFDFVLWGLRIG